MEHCNKFQKLLDNHDIDQWGTTYAVYGRSRYADDGDGHIDDMTNSYAISFCPFCGKSIVTEESNNA